jgi:hypothetical protein
LDLSGLLTENGEEKKFWYAGSVKNVKMEKMGLNLGERVSVGRGGQVNKLMDMLASIKWPTDHLRYEVESKGWVTGVPG